MLRLTTRSSVSGARYGVQCREAVIASIAGEPVCVFCREWAARVVIYRCWCESCSFLLLLSMCPV